MTEQMTLEQVIPQPSYIESSGRWEWLLPEHAQFPGCCKSVVTASREWWEYTPSEARPHPMAEAIQLRDGIWYWVIPSAIDAHLNAAKDEAVAMDKVTLTAPERIYLQISDDPEHRNEEFSDAEVTWCSESVLECEVEYVRTDLAHPASPDVVRDAERYRWLRKHSVFANDSMHELWFDASLDRDETEQLDKQIDDAMSAREDGK